jgi:hypothetical protein
MVPYWVLKVCGAGQAFVFAQRNARSMAGHGSNCALRKQGHRPDKRLLWGSEFLMDIEISMLSQMTVFPGMFAFASFFEFKLKIEVEISNEIYENRRWRDALSFTCEQPSACLVLY